MMCMVKVVEGELIDHGHIRVPEGEGEGARRGERTGQMRGARWLKVESLTIMETQVYLQERGGGRWRGRRRTGRTCGGWWWKVHSLTMTNI